MFEYVKLRNFKSFAEVSFELTDKQDKPKNLALIYGENGVGKSNLASAFFMLSETFRTMNVRDVIQLILSEEPEQMENDDFARFIKMRYKDIETLIKENKTVGSNEKMYMEFGFKIKGKKGRYIIETNNTQIIHEKLEYTLIKNRGIYCDIKPGNIFINEKIINEKTVVADLKHACEQFWGKHSFLSILDHEANDKSDDYLRNQLSKPFRDLMNFLFTMSCKVKFGSKQEREIIGLPSNIYSNYDEGEIDINEEPTLDKAEKMLNLFFTTAYRDIKKVYFKKTNKNNAIHYNLMLKKDIAGQERDIDFSLESTGMQSLLQLLPYMLVVSKGSTAIIDEFDTGIHDILIRNLITSLYQHLQGQLIITTHNTLLMEADLPKECIYVINATANGGREIKCITYYDNKIHSNTNIRNQYLLGRYNGIPENAQIDFGALLKLIE